MATEPQNHTLRLLRDIRAAVAASETKIDALDQKIDRVHVDLGQRIDGFSQVLAGEIIATRTVNSDLDRRLRELEGRISVLEQRR